MLILDVILQQLAMTQLNRKTDGPVLIFFLIKNSFHKILSSTTVFEINNNKNKCFLSTKAIYVTLDHKTSHKVARVYL